MLKSYNIKLLWNFCSELPSISLLNPQKDKHIMTAVSDTVMETEN